MAEHSEGVTVSRSFSLNLQHREPESIMSIRKKLAVLAMAVSLLGLAACGKSEQDKPKDAAPAASAEPAAPAVSAAPATPAPVAPAAAADAPKQLVKWTHGVIKLQTASGFEMMALEKQYFKKYGIDMEYKEFISAPLMAQALSSGALDSIESNPVSALLADSKGGSLKIIGSTAPGLDFAIYSKKEYTKISDLQGKHIGTSAAKDLPDLVMRAIFMKNGLPPENAIYAAVGGNADRINALAGGVVDADVNSLDMLPVVESHPELHMLALASDIVPDFPRLMVMVNSEHIKSKPRAAVVGVLAAMMEGLKYASEHKDETEQLTAKYMNVPVTDPRIDRYITLVMEHHYLTPKMEPQTKKINFMQDFAVQMKMIPAKLPDDKIMDMSYRDEAYKLVYGNQ
jgi:ABC-type nitrate/sulfonate/bicarbonate transport system substrate-binding protein